MLLRAAKTVLAGDNSMSKERHSAHLLIGAALLAFFVVPALHLVNHQNDHIHVGSAIIRLSYLQTWRPALAPRGSKPHSNESSSNSLDHHAKGGLAHFGASVVASAQLLILIAVITKITCKLPCVTDSLPRQSIILSYRARAPPNRS